MRTMLVTRVVSLGLAAMLLLAIVARSGGVEAQQFEKMTDEMLAGVGAGKILLDVTAADGSRIIYWRPDVYDAILKIGTIVRPFPIQGVGNIVAMNSPTSPTEIYIVYEASPAGVLKCEFVMGQWKCK